MRSSSSSPLDFDRARSKEICYSYDPTFRLSKRQRRNEVSQMVKVSVEVRSGSARFWVSLQAQSIQQATNIVAGWYPDKDVRMKFPLDPEGFIVEDSVVRMGR
jgi:hypothetical protein